MLSKKHQSPIESNNAFTVKIEDLVREIVIQNSIPYYRIESRMEHYSQDGADIYLPVIRIITYFEDTVSQISEIIKGEFDIAIEKSIDKKKVRIDSFSYKHVQYIAGLKENRRELTEYKRSGNKKFEIQVCSMLQDAWTGIEKELGYDNSVFPEETKRDFYRVGALLEMADIEFCKIRSHIDDKDSSSFDTANSPGSNEIDEAEQAIGASEYLPMADQATSSEIEVPVPQPSAPVETAHKTNVFANAVQSLVPTRAIPTKPQIGLAPQRFKVPAVTADDGNKAQSLFEIKPRAIHTVEAKKEEAQKTAEPVKPPTPVLKAEPVEEPAISVIHTAAPLPSPAPVAEIVEEQTIELNPIEPITINIDELHNLNVNTYEIAESTAQAKDTEKAKEQVVPFFEDVIPSANKSAALDENAPMSDASLREYVLNSKLLKEVDQKIAERAGAKINPEIDIEGDVERLRFLKVFTLKQLHDRIMDNKNDIVAFAEKWIGKDNGGSFDSGISLFYLEYLLVGKKNDPAFAIEYVVKFISDNDYSARYIIPTYNSIRNTELSNFSHLTLKV